MSRGTSILAFSISIVWLFAFAARGDEPPVEKPAPAPTPVRSEGDTTKPSEPPPATDAPPASAAAADTPETAAEKPADATSTPAAAPETAVLPGHSSHGEVFDEGPRGQAYLMGGTGRVHLRVTSDSAGVQPLFDQGVGQLHGFWYLEAERSFRQCAALDPNCAMAYWGMAMANTNNEKRAKSFIEKAVALKEHASPREALWIDGLAAFYAADSKKDKERRRELIRALERIVQDYPEELEAKAFLAVQIWQNSSHGLPISSHQAVDSLLSVVLAAEPLHPAHHYRIHLWDKEKSERALASAALCGAAAPAIAHMWHMPGHTYSALHRYADAAWQQEASARVDHAYMIRNHILPDQIHNYAHNNEWLIRDLAHIGRVRDAVELARNMIELPRHPEFNVPTKTSSSQYGRARLFDVLLQYELWDEFLATVESVYLEPNDVAADQIARLRSVGVAHLGKGDVPAAKVQIAGLEERLAKIKSEQQTAGEEAEKKALEEKKPEDQAAKAKKDAMARHDGEIKQIETALADLTGRMALAAGEFEKANAEFAKAADLPKVFLAQVAMMASDAARAEQLAREATEAAVGEVLPLAVYTEILWRIGKTTDAKQQFEKLRAISTQCDLDVPAFARLAPVAADMGLAGDWRAPAVTAADFGARPPLDSLGPFRWYPPAAEPWTLVDADGKQVGLRDYSGRPIIVVFYLGFGCLHCVDQLRAIEPLASEFADSGISLVAISTETTDQLKAALAKLTDAAEPSPSMPILVDPQMQVFRQYRAFDDFENVPLHGTFLIDRAGLVRWQDIGPEPFMDMKFLAAESKRLLALPGK